MKRSYKNPKKWERYLCMAAALIGGVLFFTPWHHSGCILIAAGGGGLLGLNLRSGRRQNLSEEELRQIDLEDRDERNLMLRDRASWLCWEGENWVSVAALFILGYIIDVDLRILIPLFSLLMFRLLIHRAVVWWLNRKY